MTILVHSGAPERGKTPLRLREDLRQRPQRAAAATEFRATLAEFGITQCRAARLFGVGPRSIRRWAHGDRRTPRGVNIVLRLLATGAVTVAQVEQAAAPLSIRTNGSVKPEPLIPVRPAPKQAAASAPVRTNGDIKPEPLIPIFDDAPSESLVPVGPADLGLAEKVYALAPGACRWPCGDPRYPDFHFCNNPVTRGSYCARHHAAAYLAPRSGEHGARIRPVAQ